MRKKQSASKAPSSHASKKDKGKKDESMTPSLATQKPHFWNMNLLPERGYDMTNATPSFLSTITNLQWDHFVLPRVGYQEEMVREFYAGITESDGPKKTYTSMVRGKIVQFHPKKINEHYMLKYNGFDFDKRVGYSSMREMEEVRNRIATPNSVWEKFSSNEIKLRSTYLIDALGNWHLFICTSILPTSHTYAMTKERLILLDTILSEGNVDIGRLIAREIYTCITKKKGFLFFPCLITELCMKAAVPIYETEHMKFLSNNLRVDMKDRMKKAKQPQTQSMPKPVPKPMPKPQPMPAIQEHFMQKQVAVWKFQNEQHDWLQLIFHHMSKELGNIEAPVFPSWVLRTPGQEEKEKEESEKEEENKENEEEADEEVEEEEEQQLRKRVTRKQSKGKKKVVIEPELEELYDSEEEDEELEKEMDKESEEEEEEESDVEVDSEEEDRARGVIMEEIARQKYAKTSQSAPQETTQTSPAKTPTESPITSPTKEPSPPLKSPTIQPQIQSPPHSPPPPSESKPEQSMPQSPTHITVTDISDLEKEPMQVREEEGLEEKQESEAVEEQEAEKEADIVQTDAPAPDASASEKTATTKHDEVAIKLVLEEMAKKKKEELGNTQKFFKSPALKKQAPKRKVAESTDATASIPASTTEETGAPAPTEETPTKQAKEKKQKVKHTPPTRQSSRTRSGAKK